MMAEKTKLHNTVGKITIRVSTNGRGQIPYDFRQRLGIKEGDTLVVEVTEIIRGNPEVGD
jgi:AbrB family looped-hinge helix DNA binding protein